MQQEISVLIADDNEKLANNLSAYIQTEKGMSLVAVARDGMETYRLILEMSPDVVIMDPILSQIDGITILNKLKNAQIAKSPKIILHAVSSTIIDVVLSTTQNVDYCLVKPQSNERICEVIRNIMVPENKAVTREDINEEIDLEQAVSDYMHEFGFPVHVKGYQYCRTAILLVVNNMTLLQHVTNQLYPEVAQIYNTTPSRVERAIRHALEVTWKRSEPRIVRKYFWSVYRNTIKPTNSEFIAVAADNIRLLVK